MGAIATWNDSVTYWTHTLFDSDRIGTPAYPANQSITGVLARLGLSDSVRTPFWLLLSVVVLALVILAMARALRSGETALALGLNAVLGLLVSPRVLVAPLGVVGAGDPRARGSSPTAAGVSPWRSRPWPASSS